MIITLAGHVDHGKSTLVASLTGGVTDRLAEERRRGLTIDLGFAYLKAGDRTLGFVDVPGHHRFIHNMVAGVAAHQHALLVIAADDGPMPQSREHLQILDLIGVEHGTVALSKCDRVSAERRADALTEIRDLVAGSFLADAPVFDTAATTGEGIDALRAHLLAGADQAGPAEAQKPFRLAIDRAFLMKGAGLVVTGMVHDGSVNVEQTLHAFPGGQPVRVRALHAQNEPATRAAAGQRAALNLTGLDAAALQRGSWLTAAPEAGHRSLAIRLRVLADFPRAVRHWSPVHVYQAASHTTARLALLEGSRLQPGEEALAQLELDLPLLAKHGDRLIIRDQGLDRTLGGGTVIDNRAPADRRRQPRRLRELDALAAATPGTALDALLALGPVDTASFQGVWHLDDAAFAALVAARPVKVRGGRLVSEQCWQRWCEALLKECEARHHADAALQGLRENDFTADVPADYRAEVLNELVVDGRLQQRAGRFQPRRHQAALSAAEQSLLSRLTPLLNQQQPPSLGDIGKLLRVPLASLQASIKALVSKGAVVQINERRLYLPDQVERLAGIAERLSAAAPFTAREYRDASGIGRNIAIDVLEYFDARGFTRRQGDTRVVVGERSRVIPPA